MKKLGGATLVTVALLLAGCAGPQTVAPAPTPTATIEQIVVPDVVGQDGLAAASAIEDAGLTPDPEWKGSRTVNDALFDVLDQSPAAGEPAAPGTVVTLEVGAPPLPPYSVALRSATEYSVTVDAAISAKEAHWIVGAVAESHAGDDGGYFVSINCATGGTASADNRLGNGTFAIGQRGATATGLSSGQHEAELLDDRTCPAPPS